MAVQPWKLAELTYAEVKALQVEAAVLPLGCTEPHNLHLPYANDSIAARLIGERLCSAAVARGARVVLLPEIPYGTVTNQRRCPLSINLNPSTLAALLADLVASLENHGVRKLVLLNGHGGNELKPFLREMHGRTGVQLFLIDWFRVVRDVYQDIFDQPDDHAGEMETSLALAFYPELVRREADGRLRADEGRTAPTRFDAVNRGWVSITRPWHLLTTNTGAGNPHAATAEKGRRLMELLESRLVPFLVELSATEVNEEFPF